MCVHECVCMRVVCVDYVCIHASTYIHTYCANVCRTVFPLVLYFYSVHILMVRCVCVYMPYMCHPVCCTCGCALFPSQTSFSSMEEDILAALGDKNPSVKAETALFLARSFQQCTQALMPKPLLKSYCPPLIQVCGCLHMGTILILWRGTSKYVYVPLQVQLCVNTRTYVHTYIRTYVRTYVLTAVCTVGVGVYVHT